MERKLLQAAVAIAGFAGVFLGLTGVLFGTHARRFVRRCGAGQLRALRQGRAAGDRPGVLVVHSADRTPRRPDRAAHVHPGVGSLSRLFSVVGHGVPTLGIVLNLIAGLILVPLLWLWQRHVAASAQRSAVT